MNDIRIFNKDEWVVRSNPQLHELKEEVEQAESSSPCPVVTQCFRSFADDPTFEADVVVGGLGQHLAPSVTLASLHYRSFCAPGRNRRRCLRRLRREPLHPFIKGIPHQR